MMEPTSTPQVKPRPVWMIPALTAAGGFVIGGLVTGGIIALVGAASNAIAEAAVPTIFTDALAICGLEDNENSSIGDDGHSLTFNMRGEEDSNGISYLAIECLLDELKVPSAVSSHVGQTTAQDGRQTESWDGITLSWSYHPDRGMDGVLTYEPE